MLYNLNLNQKAIIESGFDIDVKDSIIMMYIKMRMSNQDSKKITRKNSVYVRVAYSQFIKNLPILKIKSKRAMSRRLYKLEEL